MVRFTEPADRRYSKSVNRFVRPLYPDGLPTGQAVLTTGGNLPAKYVIHTVGPIYGRDPERESELLAACYQNSLNWHGSTRCRRSRFHPFQLALLVIQRLKPPKFLPPPSSNFYPRTSKSNRCDSSFSSKETRACFSSTRNSSRLSSFAELARTSQELCLDTVSMDF